MTESSAVARWELGSGALFERLTYRAYLNFAAVSPPSRLVLEASQRVLYDYAERGVAAVMTWVEQRERLREQIGALIGALKPERTIALMPNTTSGIIATARSIRWQRGDRVVLFEGEFPSNVTPWQEVAKQRGLELSWCSARRLIEGGGDLSELEAILNRGARLVAVSAVTFQTGWRMPLEAIGELCERHGAELFVDGIQACGVVPIEVEAMRIDYLACGGHKWLLGLEGAGFLYLSQRALERSLHRGLAGWLSHEEPFDFLMQGAGRLRYDKSVREEASFLEAGALNAVGYAALGASLEALLGLGIDAIYSHVGGYLDVLEEALLARCDVVSERSARRELQSGALSVVPRGEIDFAVFLEAMTERKIAVSTPDGRLRMAPHWPNSRDEIEEVVEAFERAYDRSAL